MCIIKKSVLLVLVSIFLGAYVVSADLMALQGNVQNGTNTDVDGNLRIFIYDNMTNGTPIYDSSSDFDASVVAGAYDVVLGSGSVPLELEYGEVYYLDVMINGEDLDFSGQERRQFQSGIGTVKNISLDGDDLSVEGGDITVLNTNSSISIGHDNLYTDSSTDIFFNTDSHYIHEDVKGTAVKFQVDTANILGHFEDTSNSPVSIRAGNTEEKIVQGTYFKLSGDSKTYLIETIRDDGNATDDVEFTLANGSQATKSTGTYNVEWVRGTQISDGKAGLTKSERFILDDEYTENHPADRNQFGYDLAISGDGTVMIVGVPKDDELASSAGSAYIYLKENNNWRLHQKIYGNESADYFGYRIAISDNGSVIAVSARWADTEGSIYTFFKNDSTGYWIPNPNGRINLLHAGTWPDGRWLGRSLDITSDGSTLVAGAFHEGAQLQNGSAHIFKINTTDMNWSHFQHWNSSDFPELNELDHFGWGAAITPDGSFLVIGAPDCNAANTSGTSRGTAYLFTLNSSGFHEYMQRIPADGEIFDTSSTQGARGFGSSIDISNDGSTIVLGAVEPRVSGLTPDNPDLESSIIIYTNSTGNWTKQAHIWPKHVTGIRDEHRFGTDVAMSSDGTTVITGAPRTDVGLKHYGLLYVLKKAGDTWREENSIISPVTDTFQYFGYSIAMSSDATELAAGAFSTDLEGYGSDTDQGAVYTFRMADTAPVSSNYPFVDAYYTLVTNSSQLDTSAWDDIKQFRLIEELDGQTIYYSLSTDNRTTFKVLPPSKTTWRAIAKDDSGTWKYNSHATYGSETWTACSVNSIASCISEAVESESNNRMTSEALRSINDADMFAPGGTLDAAATIYSSNPENLTQLDNIEAVYSQQTGDDSIAFINSNNVLYSPIQFLFGTSSIMTISRYGAGFGISSPRAPVHVKNTLLLEPTPSPQVPCDQEHEGSIYYDGLEQIPYFCNGVVWDEFGEETSNFTTVNIEETLKLEPIFEAQLPCDTGQEGQIYYDQELHEPCFCDGSDWKQFDGGGTC